MLSGNIRRELIYNAIIDEFNAIGRGDYDKSSFPKSTALISQTFSGKLNDVEIFSIVELVLKSYLENRKEKIELITTAPPSFLLKTKRINNAVKEIVENAKKSLLITGYSISEFVEDIIDTIIEKSQRGLFVKIFINDLSKQKSIDKLLRYQGKFLQLYNYANNDDKMAALHAKIILADGERAIISSANLSYHGMSGNIDMGTLINSVKLGKQIEEFFKSLVFQKVFSKI